MSSAVFVFLPSVFILIASPTAMQSILHRRRSDAGFQAASHAQAAPTGSNPIDAIERPTASSKPCNNSAHTLSDDSFPPSNRSTSSSLNRPLTASFVVQDIQERLSGRVSGAEWNTYQITSSEWDILRTLLERRGGWEKLRCDYFSKTQTFVHRMLSHTHEITSRGFAMLLYRGLASICRGAPEKEQFMLRIRSCGSSDVESEQDPDMHQPDDYFSSQDDLSYGSALEVAYSQKSEQLEKLAQFYLFETSLNTQKVIGISIDYDRSKRVTLHTWQRDNSNTTTGDLLRHYSQEVRTETGARVSGLPLQISVFDIAPPSFVPSSLHGATIQISLDELRDEIELGELATADRKRLVSEKKARQSQGSDGLDRDEGDSFEEDESEDDALTGRLDEDLVLSRAGRNGPESGRSPIRTRSRSGGAVNM